jgi:hypothetical protein
LREVGADALNIDLEMVDMLEWVREFRAEMVADSLGMPED